MKRQNLWRGLGYLLLFSVLWWSFTDGSNVQLWFGAIVVVLATVAAMRLSGKGHLPHMIQEGAIVRFIPYFLYESAKGGALVAKLAILPQRFVRSEYIEYRTSLPKESTLARMLFASTICIFPGTLSCGYDGDDLLIHVLDVDLLDRDALAKLERMIAAVFTDFVKTEGSAER